MAQTKLSEEDLKNMSSYSQEITTIEDDMLAVRMTVGQYLGYTGNKGWLNGIRELVQNVLDELQDVKCTMGTHGLVIFREDTQEITCIDDGRGVPHEDIERVYTDFHTSKNYTKTLFNYSAGRHGVGAKVTNAVSSFFYVTSCRFGKCKEVSFENGLVKSSKITKCSEIKHGTIVKAIPHECMQNPHLTVNDVLFLIQTLVPLTKLGTTIEFEGYTRDGKVIKDKIKNVDGLLTHIIMKTTTPLIEPVYLLSDSGEIKGEILFTYDINQMGNLENITSFGNYCPTVGGTHVDGFINAICKFFKDDMNNIYLANYNNGKKKKNDLKVTNSDVKSGLIAVIHGLTLYPTFTGQAKEVLSNDEIKDYFESFIPNGLSEWFKAHPRDLDKLRKYFKDVAELRIKSDESIKKISIKYETSNTTGMPAKYLKPNGPASLGWELIITEGDSAAGSFKNSRNAQRQGLFPIRGKIINAFDNKINKVLDNAEIQAFIRIIDAGYGKNFDLSKVKWQKIIFATDADSDGGHISSLLLKFFIKYMRPLVEDGRIYKAIPPLYSYTNSKGNKEYFTTELDYIEYCRKEFLKNNEWLYENGTKVNNKDATKILYDNSTYVDEVDRVTYNITNPVLLETVLINRMKPIKELKKVILKRHRFMNNIYQDGNTIVINGVDNQKTQTIFLNDQFIHQCEAVIRILDKSVTSYLLNGRLVSLYELMYSFKKCQPKVERNKGLGSQNPQELAESTLYPNETRRLIRYTVDDINKDIDKIKYLNSNKQALLKSVMMK